MQNGTQLKNENIFSKSGWSNWMSSRRRMQTDSCLSFITQVKLYSSQVDFSNTQTKQGKLKCSYL